MNRRSFLAAIFAAAAAGTLMTDTKVAQAISLFPEDRISRAISLARRIQASGLKLKAGDWHGTEEHAAWMVEGDELFRTMMKDFPVLATIDEAIFLFDGLIRVTLSEADMRKISEDLVPLAIVRHLATVDRLPFYITEMPALAAFCDQNRSLIMALPSRMTAAGRSVYKLKMTLLTDEQAGRVLTLYYAARDAGRLDQPIDFTAENIYGA
jgi:hypothetical protein